MYIYIHMYTYILYIYTGRVSGERKDLDGDGRHGRAGRVGQQLPPPPLACLENEAPLPSAEATS